MQVISAKSSAAGFSLLEVLIALLVMSVGLLGIAGMVTSSLKANDSAYLRSTANSLAYSILDRMRANRQSATQGGYNIAMGTLAPVSTACLQTSNCSTTQLAALCLGAANTCTPNAMAQADLSMWKQDLATDLPAGDGSVSTALDANGVIDVTIVIQWNAARAAQALAKFTTVPAAGTTNFTIVSGL
ncbi:MAG TPA: type IV pilus modification protein PilV [Gammaproteobacteria bacterium]|nr:type IV pilus modification protein PilV [Gammaproteobacteria bacterium]